MKFKTEIFERFKKRYLEINPNASFQEIEDSFNKSIINLDEVAKEEANRNKKKGDYWLTKEGRDEVRDIWDQPYDLDTSIPLIYLNEIERLERQYENIIEDNDKLREKIDKLFKIKKDLELEVNRLNNGMACLDNNINKIIKPELKNRRYSNTNLSTHVIIGSTGIIQG